MLSRPSALAGVRLTDCPSFVRAVAHQFLPVPFRWRCSGRRRLWDGDIRVAGHDLFLVPLDEQLDLLWRQRALERLPASPCSTG